jgi:hypothetical protein
MRRSSRLLLLALVAAIAGIYPLLAPTAHRIDRAHYERVKGGMTRADVEAIFGVPPGQYDWAESDLPYTILVRYAGLKPIQPAQARQIAELEIVFWHQSSGGSETWTSRHGAFAVGFDREGRVVTTRGDSVRIVPPWQRWWQTIWNR